MKSSSIKMSANLKNNLLKPNSLYLVTFGPEEVKSSSRESKDQGIPGYYYSTTEYATVTHLPIYALGKHIKVTGSFIYIEEGFRKHDSMISFNLLTSEDTLKEINQHPYGTGMNVGYGENTISFKTIVDKSFMVGNVSVSVVKESKSSIMKEDWFNQTYKQAYAKHQKIVEMRQKEHAENLKTQKENQCCVQICKNAKTGKTNYCQYHETQAKCDTYGVKHQLPDGMEIAPGGWSKPKDDCSTNPICDERGCTAEREQNSEYCLLHHAKLINRLMEDLYINGIGTETIHKTPTLWDRIKTSWKKAKNDFQNAADRAI